MLSTINYYYYKVMNYFIVHLARLDRHRSQVSYIDPSMFVSLYKQYKCVHKSSIYFIQLFVCVYMYTYTRQRCYVISSPPPPRNS